MYMILCLPFQTVGKYFNDFKILQ